MTYCIGAGYVTADDNGSSIIIGFADNDLEPSKFIILQQALDYDEQDRKLGMDKIHIQVEAEDRSHYGGINHISLRENTVRIALDDAARTNLQIDGDVLIEFAGDRPKFAEAVSMLKKMAARDGVQLVE